MEFRILGSIEAVGDDGPLALLLLNANTVVSRDRLVDALWGAEPPNSAVSSLQVYVHGLRRALGGDRIERHGTGYRLHLDPSALDLSRFERLVDRAAVALAAGRAAAAGRRPPPRCRARARPPRRACSGAGAADRGRAVPRARARPARTRALPLGTAGRRARRLPGGP